MNVARPKHAVMFIEVGKLIIDVTNERALVNTEPVKLYHQAYLLLEILASGPERFFSYDWLMDELICSIESLRAYMNTVRNVIGKEAIKTYHGAGIKLISDEIRHAQEISSS